MMADVSKTWQIAPGQSGPLLQLVCTSACIITISYSVLLGIMSPEVPDYSQAQQAHIYPTSALQASGNDTSRYRASYVPRY